MDILDIGHVILTFTFKISSDGINRAKKAVHLVVYDTPTHNSCSDTESFKSQNWDHGMWFAVLLIGIHMFEIKLFLRI